MSKFGEMVELFDAGLTLTDIKVMAVLEGFGPDTPKSIEFLIETADLSEGAAKKAVAKLAKLGKIRYVCQKWKRHYWLDRQDYEYRSWYTK